MKYAQNIKNVDPDNQMPLNNGPKPYLTAEEEEELSNHSKTLVKVKLTGQDVLSIMFVAQENI